MEWQEVSKEEAHREEPEDREWALILVPTIEWALMVAVAIFV